MRGPTPPGRAKNAWYTIRAEYLAASYHLQAAEVESDLRLQDDALSAFTRHDAVVLWFEHDLFDQSVLIYLLDWFSRQEMHDTVLRLICIDGYPGVQRFTGLGNLSASQLGTLCPTSRQVTQAQLALVREAWVCWCSPTPELLHDLLAADTSALPFLRAAVRRHLEDFPSSRNGIGRTGQMALDAMSEGHSDRHDIFRRVQDAEEAPWMGDTMLWAGLDALRKGWDCRADYLALSDLDLWRAGVHLTPANIWRWNPNTRALAIQ